MTVRRPLLLAGAALAAIALLAACSPVTTLNALVPRGSYQLDDDIAYGTGPRQRLDVYRPTQAAPPGGHPLVVFFYGGSWNEGSRGDYRFVGEALASRGIIAVVPDYRLYPDVRYPEFLVDSAGALAYAMQHAARLGADPKRVFVMGHSAGGYNAAMLALDRRWLAPSGRSPAALAGWIGLAGAYDFYPMGNPAARPVFFHPNYPPDSQPIGFVGAGSPPAFLAAPVDDPLVDPARNTRQMADKLDAAGVPVELRIYPRVSHVTLVGALAAPLRWLAPVLDDVSRFVRETPPR